MIFLTYYDNKGGYRVGLPQAKLFEVILGLSEALDLVDPVLSNHHKKVAYIAAAIAEQLGEPINTQRQLVMAGALHDIGSLSIIERISILAFEDEYSHEHAQVGYYLLKSFAPLESIADIVRFHHLPWNYGQGKLYKDVPIPLESHIIHLADRIAVLVPDASRVLEETPKISKRVVALKGSKFVPEQVEAFLELADTEYFWLDIVSNQLDRILAAKFEGVTVELTLEELVDISRIFSRIVDFRSPVNAAHSSGVASSAYLLSKKLDFDNTKSNLMLVAGYLHDIGKVAVPPHILEKPTKLTREEFLIVKRHTYYTHSILSNIKSFDNITKWAAYHHEKLDGTGYPFHLTEKDLPFESQVMSVVDVFTAVTEDRPYRAGMQKPEVIELLYKMVKNQALNGDVVKVLIDNYDEINYGRFIAQQNSLDEYAHFLIPFNKKTSLRLSSL